MQVKELKQDGLSHEMEVTITAKDIDKRVDTRLKEVGKTMTLPGFRKGKVPLNILKKRYGKAIMGEVLEQAVNESSAQALQDKELQPAIQPKIEVKSKDFGDGNDLVYTMAVDVLPQFKITELKDLKLERLVAKPDDKAVEDALGRLAESSKTTKPVETKRGAKDGDTVVIHFKGRTADDNVEHEGMEADDHHLTLGSGMFIPGFEEQLIGKKAGDKAEVKVGFPENYGAPDLAGRDAIFDVEIKELREPAEAKVDDEFAKTFGLDSLDALKKAIGEQVEAEMGQHSRLALKKNLLDALDEAHDFEIPPAMLEIEHTNIMQQLELEQQRNPEAEKKELSAKEEAEYKEIAERRVRLGLVLAEIGRENNIQISDPELQKAVIMEAQRYPGQEKDVFDYYAKNRQALESLRAPLFEDKVVDYILELAKITEKTVSAEELAAVIDGEDEEKPKKKTAAKKSDTAKKPAAKKKDASKPSEAKKKKAS